MDEATHTLATDEATGSVRPADARYNRTKFTSEQLAEIREQEIEDATVALLEQRKAQEEANQKALDASGYVNPTVTPEESPTARAFEKVYGAGSSSADDDTADDDYDDLSYADLQSEAKNRGLNAGGNADELKARLREDDAADRAAAQG